MKKLSLAFVVGLSTACLFAFAASEYVLRNNTAEVNEVQGIAVFVDSKPVKEYEFLGTEKAIFNDKYSSARDVLVKKARKEYPTANAIILYPPTGELSSFKCDAIHIK